MDRAYEDKLSAKISDAMWERKSAEWESDLIDIQHKIRAHESANTNYYKTGVAILELANNAYDMYLQESREEQRKLLNTLLSNCTIYRGTICPTYNKPFDILAKGSARIAKRPQYHSPQTSVEFELMVRRRYSRIDGSRWITID